MSLTNHLIYILQVKYCTSGINKGAAVCASYTVTCYPERSSGTRLLCRMSTGSEKSPDEQLLAACASGDLGVVERIENLTERINSITDNRAGYRGWTPLHHACS